MSSANANNLHILTTILCCMQVSIRFKLEKYLFFLNCLLFGSSNSSCISADDVYLIDHVSAATLLNFVSNDWNTFGRWLLDFGNTSYSKIHFYIVFYRVFFIWVKEGLQDFNFFEDYMFMVFYWLSGLFLDY